MSLSNLVLQVEKRLPGADSTDIARMVLLLSLRNPSLDRLSNPNELEREFRDVQYRIQATSDQHSAVAEELDSLAGSDASDFSPDHVWTLIRAIKVQSHILQMYLEPMSTQIPSASQSPSP